MVMSVVGALVVSKIQHTWLMALPSAIGISVLALEMVVAIAIMKVSTKTQGRLEFVLRFAGIMIGIMSSTALLMGLF